MNAKYRPILFDADGKQLVQLADRELKKDAEADLDATTFPFHHAEIKTVYFPKRG